ncbi:MAG: hypothetical protein IIU02_04210 [Treponema sp.]|uniref:PG0541 family transporter-associated protein n=1 Tax=Treponema sp. TaxID=166 RepID=UPI00257C9820|nr:PG0541 family transporter-associated protein [Treponema sp.]MBQ5537103.1 hypothetical protein [Treponema sp.]
MFRAEIIANNSVQDDIIEVLEENIPGILYTIQPLAHGRGGNDYKLGSGTWPETNFILVSYIEDEDKDSVRAIIAAVKKRFPDEGIKLFFVRAED